MPAVSIITVCLNEKATIARTLDSILSQTNRDFELIVIDGGSDDGTVDIINKYLQNIEKFVSEKDNGIFHAQNKGANLAEGEYLLFLNAGDAICDSYLIKKFVEHKNKTDIISGDIVFERGGRLLYRRPSPDKITRRFMLLESLPHPASFIRRELLLRAGRYDMSKGTFADYDFFMKALFEMNATYSRLSHRAAIFNLDGISSGKDKSLKAKIMRENIQNEYLNSDLLMKYRTFNPIFDLLFKKIPHFYYRLRGI